MSFPHTTMHDSSFLLSPDEVNNKRQKAKSKSNQRTEICRKDFLLVLLTRSSRETNEPKIKIIRNIMVTG
jgi:hypothetical protein